MAKIHDRVLQGVLGDINPTPRNKGRGDRSEKVTDRQPDEHTDEANESMAGGSRHDRTQHPGSRDVTEGVTGGVGTETGGTRNYRSGTGATGGDIGNRPE